MPTRAPLRRAFFSADPVAMAHRLLGKTLVHAPSGRAVGGRIVEVEAYLGPEDLACHSSKGRTARTEVMFGPPGHAYVFLVYGLHHCVNVVTGGGAAVLIRALAPVEGLCAPDDNLTGPGRLTRALGITRAQDGAPLFDSPLFLTRGAAVPPSRVEAGPRIGVDSAGAWAHRPLRFWLKGDRHVSRPPK